MMQAAFRFEGVAAACGDGEGPTRREIEGLSGCGNFHGPWFSVRRISDCRVFADVDEGVVDTEFFEQRGDLVGGVTLHDPVQGDCHAGLGKGNGCFAYAHVPEIDECESLFP